MCPATALQPPRDRKAWGPRSRPAALLRGGKRLQPWGATRWAAGTLGTADWAEDREAARPRRRSLTTGRRDSAPGVRDRARRSLRARLERVPSELSEPLSSEITMKSSMAAGPGRASARVAGWPATLAAAATSVPAAEAAAAATNLAITLPAPPLPAPGSAPSRPGPRPLAPSPRPSWAPPPGRGLRPRGEGRGN